MAYVITEPCIGVKDKACTQVCPFDSIHGGDESPQMYISPMLCTNCGACILECPVDAIFDEDEVPAKWRHFIALNAAYFQ